MKKDEFITERTKIISEMLDNPDKYGIYPTGRCFEKLDSLFNIITTENKKPIELTHQEKRDIPAIGTCEICKDKNVSLFRTYHRYEKTKCLCHGPYHFDLINHCENCMPKVPTETKITHKVIDLATSGG